MLFLSCQLVKRSYIRITSRPRLQRLKAALWPPTGRILKRSSPDISCRIRLGWRWPHMSLGCPILRVCKLGRRSFCKLLFRHAWLELEAGRSWKVESNERFSCSGSGTRMPTRLSKTCFLMNMSFEVIHFEELVAYVPWMQPTPGSVGLPSWPAQGNLMR